MDQRDFNKQMDVYLRDRKGPKTSFLNVFKGSPTTYTEEKKAEPEPEVIVEPEPTVVQEEATPEDEAEFSEEPRVPFWKRWFAVSVEEEVIVEDVPSETPAVDSDVKDMLKICVGWINKLPPDEIHEIKRSDNYMKFKQLLDKYGLLKK